MSACSFASVDDVSQYLLQQEDGARLCVEHRPCDDVSPALLSKARQIAEAGKQVLIVCSDGVAAERYRALLANDPVLAAPAVVSMRELCLRVMEDARVQEAVGRAARIVDDNELDVLMEDVKVSGLKPGRLREMLKFFYKSMSDCADEQDGWLITAEEQTVHAILMENLEVRRAALPFELASLAYRGLVGAGIRLEPLTLVVDDYSSLGKAAQRLVRHLATEGLVASGSTVAAVNADEPYPCFEGFRDLAAACDGLAMLYSGCGVAARTSVALEDPEAEFSYVAQAVADRLANGIEARDVLVAVPNVAWGARMASALEARGVAVELDAGAQKIKGDPRLEGRCANLKLAAFLRLYLDPDDFTALRSWLGFGDWLLRSDAFLELMAHARERDLSVPQAIEQLRARCDADRVSTLFGKFDAPLDELEQLREACRDIACDDAVKLFAQHGMPLSPACVALLGDDPARADFDRLAREAFAAPVADAARNAVSVAAYRRCHGRRARVVFVTGLVNGFLPANDAVDDKFTIDHRRVALERERTLFLDVVARASEEVVCTRFERDLLENTAKTRVQTSRVFVRRGERYATVAPSEFASAADDVLRPAPDVPRELPTRVLYASSTL